MDERNTMQSKEFVQNLKSISIIISSVILTALIVGVGIFWWQKTIFQTEQRKFQQEVISLNNQLELVRQENENLSEQITKLKSKDREIIDESISQTGWKKFSSDGKYVFSTENWSLYSIKKDDFSFSIKYPSEWQLNGSVFDDASGNKIAEFLPGLVVLSPNQKCFDFDKEENRRIGELISRTSVSIGGKTGVLEINKTGTQRGVWYPNIFCLSEGEKAFVMSFYEHELGGGNRELFEEILTTLKFE